MGCLLVVCRTAIFLFDRRETYPPPPENCESAANFMKSEQYRDKQFAQYYQGLVSGSDDEKALAFARPDNLAKLDENKKQINADGTFRSAQSMRVGHMCQCIKRHMARSA